MAMFRFCATGDSMITRPLPEGDTSAAALAELIGQADVRFSNLEMVIRNSTDGFPAAEAGGTWATGRPQLLEDLRRYHFNLLAWATNHTLDYSHDGLQATARHLDAAGFTHIGAGDNLAEASSVKYLETAAGRVGCIAAVSTCPTSWIAGDQRPDMVGRPGVNPLRFKSIYQIPEADLRRMRELAASCHINTLHDQHVKEGFYIADPPELLRFGQHFFKAVTAGQTPGVITEPNPADMQRMFKAIGQARAQADTVIVSIHAHEIKNTHKDQPADFLVEFAHRCIDAGAHAIIGHGPHILRGVEIYKHRPIFYSLGNFIFQNETVESLPADFYEKYGLSHDNLVADALTKRTNDDKLGLGQDPRVWSSVVANWSMKDGELHEMAFHPIELGYGQRRHQRGWPRLTQSVEALENLRVLSLPFGTTIRIQDGLGTWHRA